MDTPAPGEITVLLNRNGDGTRADYERLAELVHGELRKIASYVMIAEQGGHTLQPTLIADEACLKLLDRTHGIWENRSQFFGAAAEAMRHILVDYGRRKHALKRGGSARKVGLDAAENIAADNPTERDREELLALDEALKRLEKFDRRQSRIVELRYFIGLTEEETAVVLGIGLRTVKRDWATARLWLRAELNRQNAAQAS